MSTLGQQQTDGSSERWKDKAGVHFTEGRLSDMKPHTLSFQVINSKSNYKGFSPTN